jgi:hypothetical protein
MSSARTIYVTGGRSDFATVTLTEANGTDLSVVQIRLGVSTSYNTPPATWYSPQSASYPSPGKAVLGLLVNEERAPAGNYYVWVDVVDDFTSQPVMASNLTLRTI